MQRPAWTITFGFICLLIVPGAILTHMSVTNVIQPLSDLPDNVVKGFDEIFKFSYLEADAGSVKTQAEGTLTKCNYLATACGTGAPVPNPTQSISTGTEKASIAALFNNSLATVERIANDKYLGTPELQATGNDLKTLTNEVNNIKDPMKCIEAVPVFCGIYAASDGIVNGTSQVQSALAEFKNSELVLEFQARKNSLNFLHALPYFMAIALLSFAFFIWKNGVCCCCREGTLCGSLATIPFILFWLISFIIYVVCLGIGFGIKYFADRIPVSVLRGDPSLDQVVVHFETNYPEFWNIVFKDLAEGLDQLYHASFFFTFAALLIVFYSLFVCCCRPWQPSEKSEGSSYV